MPWETLPTLAKDDLVTIGPHTINHFALSKPSPEELSREMASSRDIIEARLGCRPDHLIYPFGDSGSAARREFQSAAGVGLFTSTTTRKAVVFEEHADYMHALRLVSLNAGYQKARYVQLFLSGAPFALWNGFKPLDVS
jgi:peptidoglycan/xylan/chitin deacetylase (PgdA/CDA1 family)